MNWIWVFIGGGLGASLRYATFVVVDQRVHGESHWGTFAVNVLGCFAIGIVATWLESRSDSAVEVRLFLMTGLLGGFTTFSAFGLDTVRLVADERVLAAALYAFGSMAAGIAAVLAGIALGRALQS